MVAAHAALSKLRPAARSELDPYVGFVDSAVSGAREQVFEPGQRAPGRHRQSDYRFSVAVVFGEPPFAPFEGPARFTVRRGRCGTLAPNLTLEPWLNSDQRSLSVGRSFGQVVYLLLFSSSCPACFNQGLPAMRDVCDMLAHRQGDIAYRAVHTPLDLEVDDLEAGFETIQEFGLDVPVVHDPARSVAREYSAPSLPWTVVIDPAGTVRYHGYGPEPELLVPEIEAMLELHASRFGDESAATAMHA